MRQILFTLLFAFVFGALAAAAPAQTVSQVKVRVNQQKALARQNLKIRFVTLVEDSRCPVDTNCVWAGNAKIEIRVTGRRGQTRVFELNTGAGPQSVTFAGYEIKLEDLDPRPATNVRINRNAYTATLAVRKI